MQRSAAYDKDLLDVDGACNVYAKYFVPEIFVQDIDDIGNSIAQRKESRNEVV